MEILYKRKYKWTYINACFPSKEGDWQFLKYNMYLIAHQQKVYRVLKLCIIKATSWDENIWFCMDYKENFVLLKN